VYSARGCERINNDAPEAVQARYVPCHEHQVEAVAVQQARQGQTCEGERERERGRERKGEQERVTGREREKWGRKSGDERRGWEGNDRVAK